ncbi:hypothetical protein [Curtobacterium flaccumfaciens]|uniref:hypothetical protein n=1 Tax=Curtobacterium flaccumfaciens TaxID=2035 RepID=UPI00159AD96C|nr:hypothetical protein [Curtobacterium flaccumfaciens]QKS86516.1 hypothetical protein FK523_02475 [Curtobacterium flaccumfaciens pv. flaccumfaciens]
MNHTTMTTTRRTRSLMSAAAAAVLLPLLLVGCSDTASDDDTTTASGGAAPGVALAECMRDRGYDMPDPGTGGGSMQLSAPDGVDPEQYQEDLKGCLDDSAAAGDAQAAQPMPGSEEIARKTAECLREQGFPDYPDDQDAQMRFQPDDQQAFDDAAGPCTDAAFEAVQGGAGS